MPMSAEEGNRRIKLSKDRICACPLFHSCSGEQLSEAIAFFHGEVRSFRKGERLKQSGDPLRFFGLVLSGNVEVSLDDLDGNHLVMAYVKEGETFGESLCFLEAPNPVSIAAVSDCEILVMDCRNLKQPGTGEELKQKYWIRFTSMLAGRTLTMNNRIQVLSKFSIREKLLAYFAQQELAAKGKEFRIAMDREHLAAYLGINRSALSRELSAMKAEGLIDYSRGSFRIL